LGGVGVVVVRHWFKSYSAVLYLIFCVCLFVLLHFQYLALRIVFCMMATLQIACAEWKLPTGSRYSAALK
jgi:hypothetical protein